MSAVKKSAVKKGVVNRFVIFDRKTCSEIVLTKQDGLENCDVDKPVLPVSDKDKKQSEHTKKLKHRRKEEDNQIKAKKTAEERRDARVQSTN